MISDGEWLAGEVREKKKMMKDIFVIQIVLVTSFSKVVSHLVTQ